MNKTKQCSRCKETKDASEFTKNKLGKDGLHSQCKACKSEYQRERAKNLVPVIPETKQCVTCKETKDAAEFPKNKRTNDGLASHCKDCNSERNQKWKKENPDKAKAHDHKRRALKADAPGNATAADIDARFEYHGNKCIYCGSEDSLEVEHRIPLARGGSNHPANLAPACRSCNSSKGTKTETEFKVFLLTRN